MKTHDDDPPGTAINIADKPQILVILKTMLQELEEVPDFPSRIRVPMFRTGLCRVARWLWKMDSSEYDLTCRYIQGHIPDNKDWLFPPMLRDHKYYVLRVDWLKERIAELEKH